MQRQKNKLQKRQRKKDQSNTNNDEIATMKRDMSNTKSYVSLKHFSYF